MKQKPEHPYFDAWLRRTRKQLSQSGCLSQVAQVLSQENEGSAEEWRAHLRLLLDGRMPPTFHLLARIETLLVTTTFPENQDDKQMPLF